LADRYCTNCGSALGEGQKFCRNCGSLVQASAQEAAPSNNRQPTPPSPEPRRRGRMGRTILGATLLVLGGIFVVFIALMLLAALVRPGAVALGGWLLNLVVFGVLAAAALYGAWRILQSPP
jgi:uncharacterized membrane protein YvbJ